jgi:hypothetical protein
MKKLRFDRTNPLALASIVLVGLLVAAAAMAQTTGTLDGKVTDDTGQALPGVTVTITSDNLIGARTVTTDLSGAFRFPSIPPGVYKLRAGLSGFSDVEKSGVRVGIDKTVTQNLQMRLATESVEVTVIGETPVVDQASTTTGANVGRELFEALPLGRNFTAIVAVAPGTSNDGAGTTVYGSSGAENTYIVDGLNSTDIGYGTEGKNMNLEFIQEVEVKTGGYQAEYGRATGGIVNVVTKAGGNEFTGDAFLYVDNDAFQGTVRGLENAEETYSSATFNIFTGYDRYDYGVDLGGYILKDRLWFFAAYDRVDRSNKTIMLKDAPGTAYYNASLESPDLASPLAGEKLDTDITRDIFAGKFTWRITDNATATVSLNGDPRSITGAGRGAGPYSTFLYKSEDGATDFLGKFDYVSGSTLLLNMLVGQHNEMANTDPATTLGGLLPGYSDQSNTTYGRDGGLGAADHQKNSRTVAKIDLTKFLTGFGDHELKFGADYEDLKADIMRRYTGSPDGGTFCDEPPCYDYPQFITNYGDYYKHSFYTYGNIDPYNITAADIRPEFAVDPETKNYSVYLQDSWKMGSRFTANVGVRWEKQNLLDPAGNSRITISDNWAPRLGAIWDVTGSGSSKLYASAGYFYESVPMDINIRALGGEVTADVFNSDRFSPFPKPGDSASILSGEGEPVDPNIKGQYIAEYILGYDIAVSTKFSVGVKGIYRALERVIEDGLTAFDAYGEPAYSIGNPGQGTFKYALNCDMDHNYDGSGCYKGLTDEERAALFTRIPDPKRIYKGLELSFNKRLADNWQMLGSYVYSKLEGNYDGAFQASTGQLDPNINSAFDYANFMYNSRGYLSGDVRHAFKLSAAYDFPFRLSTGFTFYYQTGTPMNRYGYWDRYGNWEVLLDPRGSVGRQPDSYEMDIRFTYKMDIGPTIAQFDLDVTNFLNRQGGVYRDEVWSLVEGDNGSPEPANDTYGKMVAYQSPTAIRLSARVTF